MGYGSRAIAGFALLAGCTAGGDIDSDTDTFDAPDIAGRYDVQVIGTNGCDERSELILDWAPGPMVVSGTPDNLTFDFLDEVVMVGSVDRTFAVQFGGTVVDAPWTTAVFGTASASDDDLRWVLSGQLEGTADDDGVDSNDCTIEAPFKATQLGS